MTEALLLRLHGVVMGEMHKGANLSQVRLSVDPEYDATGVTLSESFPLVPGTSPKVGVVSNFLGGYVPEGPAPLARRGEWIDTVNARNGSVTMPETVA